MNDLPAVSVVIPCYDEEAGLPALFERLAALEALGWEFVFVDDGSRDDTFAALLAQESRHARMRVVRHGLNLGLGAALRTGFAHASGRILCTIDSACTHPPERLPELVRLIDEGADIATGFSGGLEAGAPAGKPIRLLLGRAVTGCYNTLVGQDVRDFTCLFRAYRREVLDAIPFRSDGATSVAEIMLRGVLDGRRVDEVSMPLSPRRFGQSKRTAGDSLLGNIRLLTMTTTLVATRHFARQRPRHQVRTAASEPSRSGASIRSARAKPLPETRRGQA